MSFEKINAGVPVPEDDSGVENSAGQVQAQISSIDDILDEIDTVLESDAQSFVSGFVQKGGQ